MKKIIVILLLLIPLNIYASTKERVYLSKCIDGDTARLIINNKEEKVRFLGIDSPESTNKIEKYGKKASNYTCNKLKNASKIEIEYDNKSKKRDNYNRLLAYVFVDDKLIEESILKNGYAKVKYINSNYKYYDTLVTAEEKAKINKKGIYKNEEKDTELESKFKKYIIKYVKKIFGNIFKEIFN